ncbi:hypothetical protein OQA88_605 [Cercophora sp. LCS_1]
MRFTHFTISLTSAASAMAIAIPGMTGDRHSISDSKISHPIQDQRVGMQDDRHSIGNSKNTYPIGDDRANIQEDRTGMQNDRMGEPHMISRGFHTESAHTIHVDQRDPGYDADTEDNAKRGVPYVQHKECSPGFETQM